MEAEPAKNQGKLYLVGTPIGNLEDISLRALRILKEADLIACEDTRQTAKLLAHYGITSPREAYHEHNERRKAPRLIDMLKQGKTVALVTDAGTPLISDPGHVLISACRREAIPVISIPGPSAVVTALAGSGLNADSFLFLGFLPSQKSKRGRKLLELSSLPFTLVFYESPHRILNSLQDMINILGPRQACLARELTKIHEEWLSGTLEEIFSVLRAKLQIKGEITLVVAGCSGESAPASSQLSLREDLEKEMQSTGKSPNEALKTIARRRGLSRREAYRLLLLEKRES
jgi:16S rRNA (cytidine1402-2'-O)-methyltransferase